MPHLQRARLILPALALAVSVFSTAQAFQSPPAPSATPDTAIALLQSGNNPLAIYRDQQTGIPNFLAGALPAVAAHVATPVAAARAFFAEQASLFRLRDPGEELALIRDDHDQIGMNHVRFQQRYNGVDVFGGVIIAHTRGTRIESISGTYFPDLSLDTVPSLTFAQGADLARAATGLPDGVVANTRSGLAIYARDRRSALAWKIELLSPTTPSRWLIFVDAHTGTIVHRIDMLETGRNRETYTMSNSSTASALPGTQLCSEAAPAGCDGDAVAKAAHDNTGIVYDYYLNRFGRDSIDGNGMTLKSSVHFDNNYNNAFWNGSQMVYGDGDGDLFSPLSQSLDVVAHELTHGVTERTANLVYEDESGALNESYSDVMGVFAEAFSRSSSTVSWALGEDVWTPNIANDALRDMADPHKGSDPFTNAYNCSYRPGQPFYCGQPASLSELARLPISFFEEVPSDTGGVHINSGIPNKVANLITDGGSFGGASVTGIGAAKAEQIYYRTLSHYLTPYSNFLAARNGSIQACADLVGQFNISAADCASVRDAFTVVGIIPPAALLEQRYLPISLSSSVGVTTGFIGRVTLNGSPVAGVAVELRLCDDRKSSACGTTVSQATTNSNGGYFFPAGAGLPNADAHTWYRVVYKNPSAQPNGRMFGWIGDDIGAYTQGDTRRLETFDIGDVTYVSPNTTTPIAFPVTFTWNARPAGSDYYFWELYDQDFNIIASAYPFLMSAVPNFTLNSATDPQLMSGSTFTGGRYWDAVVVSSAGYGISYNSGSVAFASAASRSDALAARRALFERYANQAHPPMMAEAARN